MCGLKTVALVPRYYIGPKLIIKKTFLLNHYKASCTAHLQLNVAPGLITKCKPYAVSVKSRPSCFHPILLRSLAKEFIVTYGI